VDIVGTAAGLRITNALLQDVIAPKNAFKLQIWSFLSIFITAVLYFPSFSSDLHVILLWSND